jgi:hypothetical protein
MSLVKKTFCTFFFLGLLTLGCDKCDDSCCGESFNSSDFKILGMNIMTRFIDGGERVDESKYFPASEIKKVIYFSNIQDIVDCPSPFHNMQLGLTSSAYACSPSPRECIQKLDSLYVIASKDDENQNLFLQGDTINNLFRIYEPYSTPKKLNYYVANRDTTLTDRDRFQLILDWPPTGEKTDILVDISVVLDDGSKFTFKNEHFKVL